MRHDAGSSTFVLVAAAFMVVLHADAAAHAPLSAQTPPAAADSATLFRDAGHLVARADTLARGSAAERGEAVDLLRQAVAMYDKAGVRGELAATLGNIGSVFSNIGQPDSALAYHRQAVPIQRAVGDRAGEAASLGNIVYVFGNIGQPDSALAYHRQAVAVPRPGGAPAGGEAPLG